MIGPGADKKWPGDQTRHLFNQSPTYAASFPLYAFID